MQTLIMNTLDYLEATYRLKRQAQDFLITLKMSDVWLLKSQSTNQIQISNWLQGCIALTGS